MWFFKRKKLPGEGKPDIIALILCILLWVVLYLLGLNVIISILISIIIYVIADYLIHIRIVQWFGDGYELYRKKEKTLTPDEIKELSQKNKKIAKMIAFEKKIDDYLGSFKSKNPDQPELNKDWKKHEEEFFKEFDSIISTMSNTEILQSFLATERVCIDFNAIDYIKPLQYNYKYASKNRDKLIDMYIDTMDQLVEVYDNSINETIEEEIENHMRFHEVQSMLVSLMTDRQIDELVDRVGMDREYYENLRDSYENGEVSQKSNEKSIDFSTNENEYVWFGVVIGIATGLLLYMLNINVYVCIIDAIVLSALLMYGIKMLNRWIIAKNTFKQIDKEYYVDPKDIIEDEPNISELVELDKELIAFLDKYASGKKTDLHEKELNKQWKIHGKEFTERADAILSKMDNGELMLALLSTEQICNVVDIYSYFKPYSINPDYFIMHKDELPEAYYRVLFQKESIANGSINEYCYQKLMEKNNFEKIEKFLLSQMSNDQLIELANKSDDWSEKLYFYGFLDEEELKEKNRKNNRKNNNNRNNYYKKSKNKQYKNNNNSNKQKGTNKKAV